MYEVDEAEDDKRALKAEALPSKPLSTIFEAQRLPDSPIVANLS